VVKGVGMFEKLDVPIAGVIENMSYFVCPHCGGSTEVFGHGGGQRVSERYNIPLLGRIPLDVRIREAGDNGHPVVISQPDSPLALAFRSAAEQTAANISRLALDRDAALNRATPQPIQFFAKAPSAR